MNYLFSPCWNKSDLIRVAQPPRSLFPFTINPSFFADYLSFLDGYLLINSTHKLQIISASPSSTCQIFAFRILIETIQPEEQPPKSLSDWLSLPPTTSVHLNLFSSSASPWRIPTHHSLAITCAVVLPSPRYSRVYNSAKSSYPHILWIVSDISVQKIDWRILEQPKLLMHHALLVAGCKFHWDWKSERSRQSNELRSPDNSPGSSSVITAVK